MDKKTLTECVRFLEQVNMKVTMDFSLEVERGRQIGIIS